MKRTLCLLLLGAGLLFAPTVCEAANVSPPEIVLAQADYDVHFEEPAVQDSVVLNVIQSAFTYQIINVVALYDSTIEFESSGNDPTVNRTYLTHMQSQLRKHLYNPGTDPIKQCSESSKNCNYKPVTEKDMFSAGVDPIKQCSC